MFRTRLISGIVLILLALLTIGFGGWLLFATILVISVIGVSELYGAMKIGETPLHVLSVAGYAGVLLYDLALVFPQFRIGDQSLLSNGGLGEMALIAALVLLMAVYVFTYPKYDAHQIMAAFFAIGTSADAQAMPISIMRARATAMIFFIMINTSDK